MCRCGLTTECAFFPPTPRGLRGVVPSGCPLLVTLVHNSGQHCGKTAVPPVCGVDEAGGGVGAASEHTHSGGYVGCFRIVPILSIEQKLTAILIHAFHLLGELAALTR